MACYFCRHFNRVNDCTGKGVVENVKQSTGQCTRSPDWREVTGLHYCSEYSPGDTKLVGFWWSQMHICGEEAHEERKRRLALEKKIKELRAQLKAR